MKYLFCFLALLSSQSIFGQTRYDVTMNVDGVDRFFIVQRPSGAVPQGGYPVVFMFHGTSGDGDKFYNISGWKEKGEAEKILTVFPSSLEYCVVDSGQEHSTTKWNNGDLLSQACSGQHFYDDVHFVRMMLDTIGKTFPIDTRRVYASGFSNGGYFTSKLAVEASDIFAAIAAASGILHPLDSGVAKRMIPIVFSFGTNDDRFYGAIGQPQVPFNDSVLIYYYSSLNRFLKIFNLTQDYAKDSSALALRYFFNTPTQGAAAEFTFVLFKGLDHEYPNGINYPVSAPDLLWPLFKQFSLPLAVKSEGARAEEIDVWPNPAHRFITVHASDLKSFTLRTILGATVIEHSAYDRQQIRLPDLPSGMYFAELRTSGGRRQVPVLIE